MAEKNKLILEYRALILGERNEYFLTLEDALRSVDKVHCEFVNSEEELIESCYVYEPMLILMELEPRNISICTSVSKIEKYRQAVSIGITAADGDNFKRLVKECILTGVIKKSDSARSDAFSIMRVYKSSMKFGVNIKSLTKHMPIVTDIVWHDPVVEERFLRNSISDKLERLGIRRELAGHKYLIAAIAMQTTVMDPPEPIKLYTSIAEYYGTTPRAVEKAIRYAIETAWISGDIDYQHKMFEYSIDADKGKPTNAEFIARLTIEYQGGAV